MTRTTRPTRHDRRNDDTPAPRTRRPTARPTARRAAIAEQRA